MLFRTRFHRAHPCVLGRRNRTNHATNPWSCGDIVRRRPHPRLAYARFRMGDAADLCEPQGIPRGVVQLPAYSSMSGGTDYEVSITTETGTGFWLAATNECLLQVS